MWKDQVVIVQFMSNNHDHDINYGHFESPHISKSVNNEHCRKDKVSKKILRPTMKCKRTKKIYISMNVELEDIASNNSDDMEMERIYLAVV